MQSTRLINLLFYYLAVRLMGGHFTIKTFCAVGLVSLLSGVAYTRCLSTSINVNLIYAALCGNIIIRLGFIVLFRHKASLGGA